MKWFLKQNSWESATLEPTTRGRTRAAQNTAARTAFMAAPCQCRFAAILDLAGNRRRRPGAKPIEIRIFSDLPHATRCKSRQCRHDTNVRSTTREVGHERVHFRTSTDRYREVLSNRY